MDEAQGNGAAGGTGGQGGAGGARASGGAVQVNGVGSTVFSLPTPCALLDVSGRIEFANAAWSNRPMGPLAAPGRKLAEALEGLPGGGPAARGIRELLAGHRLEFTCDLSAEGGSWLRVFATRDTGGAVLVVLVDVTDHPSSHGRKEMERRFQRIVESAMDGIITVDGSGRVVLLNAAAERIFGVTAAEALGGTLARFLPVKHRETHGRFIEQFGRTGVSSRTMGNLGTISGVRSNGNEFPIEASISHVSVGGQQYFTVILRDVSERKRLEAQLLQAQKMEGVGRLAGGIAHDFNNLLMAIFNYLALASRKLGADHPVTASIGQAQRAAERAADLTRQLLTFARRQVIAQRILSPREVATGLTPMLRRLIGEDVSLKTVAREDTGNVRADPAQLEQVLVNLAVNARDAMPHGGTLTIETRNKVLDEACCRTRLDATPGEYVVMSVTDTGTGMTPEVQARLFEPFFTTKPTGKGTGLGLATCHGIVKQSGGHIGVYSELGRGTSVRVYLPRVLSDAPARPESPAPRAAPRGTETILLVEDSALVRELVAEGLADAGYTVLQAASGPDALKLLEEHAGTIDLMLTDVVMPGMSGVQLGEAVLKLRPMPIIYMSGYTEETIAHHAVNPEHVTFIAKPFMSDTLLHLVHRVLRAGKV
jgi:PAS domain S-box-containing protein